eukprot:g544.t1
MSLCLRNHALQILSAACKAVDPAKCVQNALRVENCGNLLIGKSTLSLCNFNRVLILSVGKAAASMAKAAESILTLSDTDIDVSGVALTKYGHALADLNSNIEMIEAAHPIPDQSSVDGASKLLSMAQSADEKTLIIVCISGGASSLAACPVDGLSLQDIQATNELLLTSGATISEMNCVRKKLSKFSGGKLSVAANPATLISLVLSDVVGDDLHVIASGPTVPDPTTFSDAIQVCDSLSIYNKLPSAVSGCLTQGALNELDDSPKKLYETFAAMDQSKTVIVGNNSLAIDAAEKAAKKLGYNTLILSSSIEGEANTVGKVYASIAKEIINRGRPIQSPACILAGGETTVKIDHTKETIGLGGRNQQVAISAGIEIANFCPPEKALIASFATDGTDGPTNSSGAVVDSGMVKYAMENLGCNAVDFQKRYDAYNFFAALEKKTESLETISEGIFTGATGTNVMDIAVILVDEDR